MKKIMIYISTFLLTTGTLLCGCRTYINTPYSSAEYAMGTIVSNTIYADKNTGREISENITDELTNLENNYLSWRAGNSLISRINKTSENGSTVMPDDKASLFFRKVLELAEKSSGAFDPSIGKIIDLWGFYDNNPHLPEPALINELLPKCSYKYIKYTDSGASSSISLASDIKLDFGAVGKGIGCDSAYQILKTSGQDVCGAVISVGGSILVYGSKPDNSMWNIAVTNPRKDNDDDNNYLGILNIKDTPCFISTSGDYEKYFEKDGVRYHHIIDPKTGYPADSGLISVTIICNDGLVSDGLSTACFVLGIKDSLPLLKEYNAEAVFVSTDKKITITDGLKDIFTLKASGYITD